VHPDAYDALEETVNREMLHAVVNQCWVAAVDVVGCKSVLGGRNIVLRNVYPGAVDALEETIS